jgi:hypothetical protein
MNTTAAQTATALERLDEIAASLYTDPALAPFMATDAYIDIAAIESAIEKAKAAVYAAGEK